MSRGVAAPAISSPRSASTIRWSTIATTIANYGNSSRKVTRNRRSTSRADRRRAKSRKASRRDDLLQKHAALAKRLKRLLDLLKPQERVRIRYQEEGSELDLDVALRSLVDLRSGATPDPRINLSHRTSGRNISMMLLLD